MTLDDQNSSHVRRPDEGAWDFPQAIGNFVADANDPRLDALPPRVLPLFYIGTAHASLVLALACVAWWPQAVTGFFYHSWMVALVHLVTLGWITLSILGVLYIVGPMALRMPLPVGRGDYVAFGLLV